MPGFVNHVDFDAVVVWLFLLQLFGLTLHRAEGEAEKLRTLDPRLVRFASRLTPIGSVAKRCERRPRSNSPRSTPAPGNRAPNACEGSP